MLVKFLLLLMAILSTVNAVQQQEWSCEKLGVNARYMLVGE